MFTGLVTHQGTVLSVDLDSMGRLCVIQHELGVLNVGESVSINGVCLTVISTTSTQFSAHVSPETVAITTFKAIVVGTIVNLERALRVGDRLGGHSVTGHIDGTLAVAAVEHVGDDCRVRFGPMPPHARAWVCPKGSVTLHGVSLTINVISHAFMEVMIIPHTLTHTNLHSLQVGDGINVEYDAIAKLVAHQYQLTHDRLITH